MTIEPCYTLSIDNDPVWGRRRYRVLLSIGTLRSLPSALACSHQNAVDLFAAALVGHIRGRKQWAAPTDSAVRQCSSALLFPAVGLVLLVVRYRTAAEGYRLNGRGICFIR
ncbi:hypothetical protein BRC68_10900 [Halobacteriales archaeon QH_6_64_20]|nr:MAG: hypothetical protein BRC68_10900 [Halobacteriales archaeon QH_6_64_20]